jgi:transposase
LNIRFLALLFSRTETLSKGSDKLRKENQRLRRENKMQRAEIAHIKRVNTEQQATLESLQSHIEVMQEQITLLRKALFSPRRERFIPSPDQKLLFESESMEGSEDEAAVEEEPDEEPSPKRKKRRKKRKRFEFPQCLPVQRIEHPLPPEELDCPCGCGNKRVIISEKISRQLEYVEASAFVIEHVRFTYGCPTNRDGQQIVTSEKPPGINEKGVFGASTLAWLAHAKFERHLPLYRLQEELLSTTTMWFNRSVLSGAIIRTGERLLPMWDLIRSQVLDSFYVRADETTARVLRPGTGATKVVYLWVYVGDQQHPYQLFDYRLDRSRAGPREILANFQGGLLTDGYSVYTSLVKASNGRLLDLGCWAHYLDSGFIWSGLSNHDSSRVFL